MTRYYHLTKPGIVRGNLITALSASLFAMGSDYDVWMIPIVALGTTGVIASACVFNNIIDRDIDSKMKRTKNRALVEGTITSRSAIIFASLLLLVGVISLFSINLISVIVALIGFISYVIVYGVAKRRTIYSTEIGSISGAIPPVIGYVAIAGAVDVRATLLFIILVAWQMPHFFSIGIFRKKEYQEAGLPIRSVVNGVSSSIDMIKIYTILFLLACTSLFIWGGASILYLIIMLAIAGYWLYYAFVGIGDESTEKWSKKMFGISLLTLLIFCLLISVNGLLI